MWKLGLKLNLYISTHIIIGTYHRYIYSELGRGSRGKENDRVKDIKIYLYLCMKMVYQNTLKAV
jgi:hypothetical protein